MIKENDPFEEEFDNPPILVIKLSLVVSDQIPRKLKSLSPFSKEGSLDFPSKR